MTRFVVIVLLMLLAIASCSNTPATKPTVNTTCIVGDLNQPPSITILTAPPDCCYGSWAGNITGIVNNVETDSIKVVLYAQTNVYWVQPWAAAPNTYPACDGTWSNGTHGGHHYCAILCKRSWVPPATLGYLPPVGGEILAITCVPTPVRTLSFAGYTWWVKSNAEVRVDPGPNYFSDSTANVWVDGPGNLHLKLTYRDDKWYCPEVYSEQYFNFGRFRFTIQGPIDVLDPNVVAAGFIYANVNQEVDIEFSRWGDPNAQNGQYVIQPWNTSGNRNRYNFTLTGPTSTHEFIWWPDSVFFESRQGDMDGGGAVIQSWMYRGNDSPPANQMRMRFNVWLFGGNPPTNGQEVELVITDFRWQDITTPVRRSSWGQVKTRYR
ncbi:MAG: hypothetical protein HY420_02290 [Candidatus Kerfeldbacteria bacterium]|nr:hypothetical protein [Candidatus Kerfeldbacteria bacterium]